MYRGYCRCGWVKFGAEGRPILTAACHCTDCQRMTAGPYSLSALYPEDRFALLEGETVVGECNSAGEHHFCRKCFSWIFTKPGGLDGMINIRTPLLERAVQFPPFAEFFLNDGLPGLSSGAPKTYASAPPVQEFLELADGYADWAGAAALQ